MFSFPPGIKPINMITNLSNTMWGNDKVAMRQIHNMIPPAFSMKLGMKLVAIFHKAIMYWKPHDSLFKEKKSASSCYGGNDS